MAWRAGAAKAPAATLLRDLMAIVSGTLVFAGSLAMRHPSESAKCLWGRRQLRFFRPCRVFVRVQTRMGFIQHTCAGPHNVSSNRESWRDSTIMAGRGRMRRNKVAKYVICCRRNCGDAWTGRLLCGGGGGPAVPSLMAGVDMGMFGRSKTQIHIG